MVKQPVILAVLISGSGSNLQSIIDHIDQGKLNARIACVISNNPDAFGLKRAKMHNIPFYCVENSGFTDKAGFEKAILEILADKKPDLIILAGFMRILSEEFISHYNDRILNIHPSLLPKYKGLNTHARALAAGDKAHGATVHVVTADLDSGEIIVQKACQIDSHDDENTLQQKVHKIEHVIYPQAITLYTESGFQSRRFS